MLSRSISSTDAHPEYAWLENKGYPTPAHKQAVLDHGHTRHHRRTFRGVQGTLFSGPV